MDRELRELHRGAREERKRLTPDASPDAHAEAPPCDHPDCEQLADHRVPHPMAGADSLNLCDEHLAETAEGGR